MKAEVADVQKKLEVTTQLTRKLREDEGRPLSGVLVWSDCKTFGIRSHFGSSPPWRVYNAAGEG